MARGWGGEEEGVVSVVPLEDEIGSTSSIIGVIMSSGVGMAHAGSEFSVDGTSDSGDAPSFEAESSPVMSSPGVVSLWSRDACMSSGAETRTRGREGVWL